MRNFTKIVALFASLLLLNNLKAATITAAATGSWTSTATWVGGEVPGAADSVVIPSGKTVTYTFPTAVAGFATFTNSPASINILGNLVLTSVENVVFVFQNKINIYVRSGATFTDNTGSGVYSFNGKSSSISFYVGSILAVGANNGYGDIAVLVTNSTSVTSGIYASPTTVKPFTISSNGTTTVLPLTVTSFVAYPQSSTVNLVWQTTNEVNVSHIYVERSTDGTSFTRVNKLSAKGGGTYTYSDDVAALSSSKVYYRLMIVDKDGSVTFSKVVNAQLSNSAAKQLSFYPNPVRDNVFVQFTATKQEKVSLKIINLQGQVVYEETLQANVGNISTAVNTSALAKGTYVLQVKGSITSVQKQFVKE